MYILYNIYIYTLYSYTVVHINHTLIQYIYTSESSSYLAPSFLAFHLKSILTTFKASFLRPSRSLHSSQAPMHFQKMSRSGEWLALTLHGDILSAPWASKWAWKLAQILTVSNSFDLTKYSSHWPTIHLWLFVADVRRFVMNHPWQARQGDKVWFAIFLALQLHSWGLILVIIQLLSLGLNRWADVVQTRNRGRTGGIRQAGNGCGLERAMFWAGFKSVDCFRLNRILFKQISIYQPHFDLERGKVKRHKTRTDDPNRRH